MRKKEPTKNKDKTVSYCRIFPSIGIARIGNSPSEYFIGPEAPGEPAEPDGGYKDSKGRMKKQAARFRIFGFNQAGQNLGEITSDIGTMNWTVSVENKKADWWQFSGAENVQNILNIDEPLPEKGGKRNAAIKGAQRKGLSIKPEPVSIEGVHKVSKLMQGKFLDYQYPITLGQCRTDEKGRLIFTGGDGKSDSVRGKDSTFLISYANNDWWFDDTSDGTVKCEVVIGNSKVEVKGAASVIVAPPDYSPHTKNVVSLYDVFIQSIDDLNLEWPENELGVKPDHEKLTFMMDIYPILRRTGDYRWVNAKAYQAHGRERLADFIPFDQLVKLANPELARKTNSIQKGIFKHIRNPNLDSNSYEAGNQANLSFMPPLSGDEGTITLGEPDTWLKLTKNQYAALEKWSNGEFENDLPSSEQELKKSEARIGNINEYDVCDQPLALIRSALEACEGGAFYPGIEITSVVRHSKFYSEAFRVDPSWMPGDISKWMALPWQADFNDCSDNWWPAVRPDDVITENYFNEVVSKLYSSDSNKDIYRALVRREKWTRGIGVRYGGFNFGSSTTLPIPLQNMKSAEEYKAYAEATLSRFSSIYIGNLPRLRDEEFHENYLRRVRNFLTSTIGAADLELDDILPGAPVIVREYLETKVKKYLNQHITFSKPMSGVSIEDYFEAESRRVKTEPVIQGVFDVTWQTQNSDNICAKNELVDAWSELGVVSKRDTPAGEVVLVEVGRDKYARLQWRDYFHTLMNIEDHQDFLPKAKELAEEFLQQARNLIISQTSGSKYERFKYSKIALDSKLEQIYEKNRKDVAGYNPAVAPGFFDTEEKIIERIRQLSPFNQLDGGWLQRVTPAGNSTKLQGLLFQIWMDELGNGDPAQNHANVYSDLMRSAGIYYSKVDTKEYSENPELWDDMFSGSVYHTSISLFPETFYPEILGMTLYLEWEANALQRMVSLYEYYGFSSLFYKLHVAIDNAVDGHGAMAKRIVELYLDEVRNESGEVGVQDHWERIWDGYVAFATGGVQRWQFDINNPKTPRERVIELIIKKRHYGSLSHHDKKLGSARINALFDEPDMFLTELENSNYIVPGNPEDSLFIKMTNPDGVMYRVFGEEEIDEWKQWIRSLPSPADSSGLPIGDQMVILLKRMGAKGVAAIEHGSYCLSGPNPDVPMNDWNKSDLYVNKPVTWWFQLLRRKPIGKKVRDIHFAAFMRAMANQENGWIVPGNPEESRFTNELLKEGAMGEALRKTRPLLGHVRGAEIIKKWIVEGCPDPVSVSEPIAENSTGNESISGIKNHERHNRLVETLENMLSLRSETIPERIARTGGACSNGLGPAMGCVQ
ncbi:MAG: iron-containing redox enzyme family protein [Oceanospirillaceae bacterium]|nr:iron-containing redox enzyme family protein [Oceanospirillaceae bacterium]